MLLVAYAFLCYQQYRDVRTVALLRVCVVC